MTDKIKTRKQLLKALEEERKQSRLLNEQASQRELELAALLAASRSVSEFRSFREAAQTIFDIAKELIGATSGYVALLSEDGTENEVLFLDAGGLPCTVDPSLPMPIRGLRGDVYSFGRVAYENSFPESEWQGYMPEGHVALENVLFTPLTIEDRVVGIMGLANKPGGFNDSDARLATVFGDLAAVAFSNDYTFESLGRSEERFRSVTQSANDAIISANAAGEIVSWNKGAQQIFGYEEAEVLNMKLEMLMPERYREPHERAMRQYLETSIPRVIGRTVEMHGVRSNGDEFPIELSLSTWKTNEGTFFTGIIRDITRRKKSEYLNDALGNINAAINSTLELDEIMQTTMIEASRALGSVSAFIAVREDASLRVRYTHGMPAGFLGRELSGDEARLLEQPGSGQSPTAVYPAAAGTGLATLAETGLQSLLPIRLTAMKELVGVVVIGYPETARGFTSEELDFAGKLAISVALAVKNASLYHKELESRGVCQNYANQLSILHDVGLSLNRETDTDKLLRKVLGSATELTSAGVGIMTLNRDGKTSIISTYYSPWFLPRCAIEGNVDNLHRRLSHLVESSDKDAFRVAAADKPLSLPGGHLDLRGLLIGVIRDTMGRRKGVFMLSHKAGNHDFTENDEEVISLLAAQCSVALISAENFEREHVVAETLQEALLPEAPTRDDMDLGLLYQSAGPLGKIGGDFYDFVELGAGRIAVVVGDVCGKGLAAATYTAMIKYMLRAYLGEGMLPGDCLTRLNRNIYDQVSIEKFVTVGLSIIDLEKGTMSYSSAGHPPPVICQSDKPSALHTQPAVPLGVIKDQAFLSTQVSVSHSGSIVMYTDGLIDARPPEGRSFGQDGVIESVGRNCGLPAQQMAQAIVDSALAYAGGSLRDDIAILVIRLKGPQV